MSDLFVSLTAPNGRKYEQPIGLFINNEFVKSEKGDLIESINPTYGPPHSPFLCIHFLPQNLPSSRSNY